MTYPWWAKFGGPCAADCGVRIVEGDLVEWADTTPDVRTVRHVTCPQAPDPLSAPHPVCPACFLTHPPGDCDR